MKFIDQNRTYLGLFQSVFVFTFFLVVTSSAPAYAENELETVLMNDLLAARDYDGALALSLDVASNQDAIKGKVSDLEKDPSQNATEALANDLASELTKQGYTVQEEVIENPTKIPRVVLKVGMPGSSRSGGNRWLEIGLLGSFGKNGQGGVAEMEGIAGKGKGASGVDGIPGMGGRNSHAGLSDSLESKFGDKGSRLDNFVGFAGMGGNTDGEGFCIPDRVGMASGGAATRGAGTRDEGGNKAGDQEASDSNGKAGTRGEQGGSQGGQQDTGARQLDASVQILENYDGGVSYGRDSTPPLFISSEPTPQKGGLTPQEGFHPNPESDKDTGPSLPTIGNRRIFMPITTENLTNPSTKPPKGGPEGFVGTENPNDTGVKRGGMFAGIPQIDRKAAVDLVKKKFIRCPDYIP